MSDIAYFIRKDQVVKVQKNMDVGSGSDKIHKMIKNKDAKKIYIVTNYGEGRVIVAEINIEQLYTDRFSKWSYRVKGDDNSKIIDPPKPYIKIFPDKPFPNPVVIRYVD